MEKGFPLSYSQPQIAWDPRGGVVLFSTRNELHRPFAEFLEHWLEAGCFDSDDIDLWLPKVKHLVPGRIRPARTAGSGTTSERSVSDRLVLAAQPTRFARYASTRSTSSDP